MKELFRGSSLCATSLPSPQWRISTKNDHIRALSAGTPTTSSHKNSWTHNSLICSCKNNTQHEFASSPRPQPLNFLQIQIWTLGDLFTLITNKHSYNKDPRGWIYQWNSQVVWENLVDWVVENSRKTLLKTQEKHYWKTLLLIWKLGQKTYWKISEKVGENWL